jgi:hypothetical protein
VISAKRPGLRRLAAALRIKGGSKLPQSKALRATVTATAQ